ncbi:hypothetical protein ABPG75_009552 [Micractinium tetrahymenae]
MAAPKGSNWCVGGRPPWNAVAPSRRCTLLYSCAVQLYQRSTLQTEPLHKGQAAAAACGSLSYVISALAASGKHQTLPSRMPGTEPVPCNLPSSILLSPALISRSMAGPRPTYRSPTQIQIPCHLFHCINPSLSHHALNKSLVTEGADQNWEMINRRADAGGRCGRFAPLPSEQWRSLKRPLCCIRSSIAVTMSLLRSLPALRALTAGLAGSQCWAAPAAATFLQQQPSSLMQEAAYSAQPQEAGAQSSPFWAVPEGHQHSDLSDAACNIGLSRRKDLTLREDVKLVVGGQPRTLAELLKGQKAVVFGVPDCGKVCSESHVPSYLAAWDELRQHGVTRLLCVAVGDPAAAHGWARSLGAGVADGSKVQVVADANGAFTRFMGMEQGAVDAAGARSLRYAAVVDDGILLKVCVDKTPAEAAASSAQNILKVLKAMH